MGLSPDAVGRRRFLAVALTGVVAACSPKSRSATPATSTKPARPRLATSTSQSTPRLPAFVRSGPSHRSEVALTFHGSGDVGLLDQLLGEAAKATTPLTIFAVGQWLDANPGLARRILEGGHELANHTYTHPKMGTLPLTEAATEIARCRDTLSKHAGSSGRWFRPSGVETPSDRLVQTAVDSGYPTTVGFDLDPHDYRDPGAAAIKQRVAAGLHAGAIVSLHTGHAGTVTAFPGIVSTLRGAGLNPVTVSDLLR